MEHSIALVTGATSGLSYAAARSHGQEGWREIIVTGRSLARAKEAAAQLAAEAKRQVFTPLEMDLNAPARTPRGRPSSRSPASTCPTRPP
jgi:NADP-dependent 3-hydroxy acid dehydrogenase YdfG